MARATPNEIVIAAHAIFEQCVEGDRTGGTAVDIGKYFDPVEARARIHVPYDPFERSNGIDHHGLLIVSYYQEATTSSTSSLPPTNRISTATLFPLHRWLLAPTSSTPCTWTNSGTTLAIYRILERRSSCRSRMSQVCNASFPCSLRRFFCAF